MRAAHHLLLLVLLHDASHTSAEIQNWHRVQVSNVTLTGISPRDEWRPRSVAQCTMMASRDPQDQLLCFRTPGVCTKYDYRVAAGHDDSPSGPVTTCWTRHLTMPPLPECSGNELKLNNDCSFSECHEEKFRPYGGQASNIVLSRDCTNLMQITPEMETWEEGRTFCRDKGGDLFVPTDEDTLDWMLKFFETLESEHVFMAAKDGAWLDGRPLIRPTGDYIYWNKRSGLHEHGNNHDGYPLCQMDVQYP